jgi:type I site-specific restriction endonuclease
MLTEADTCRKFAVPLLQKAGWETPPCVINEQRSFTDGRVVFVAGRAKRGKQKCADYKRATSHFDLTLFLAGQANFYLLRER